MKPTKKQLSQNVNELVNKQGEKLEDIEIIDLLKDKFSEPARVLALAKELDITLEECINDIIETGDGECFEYGREEYLILTDSEADERNDQSIENYIDECILPDLPERYRYYFDNEAFKRDARMDGRGHNLASYDGNEEYQTVDNETYYIYRTN